MRLRLGEISYTLNNNPGEYALLSICLLSHGDQNDIKGVDGEGIHIQDIIGVFGSENCQEMIGKPKLFFINACRGQNDLRRVKGSPLERDGQASSNEVQVGPEIIDYLLVNSTLPGYTSFRSPETGSVFVVKLCQFLNAFGATEDLETILKALRDHMKNWSHKNPDDGEYVTQIPEETTTLVSKVYFDVQS